MDERYFQAKKVTLIGAFVNALLGIIKVIGGYLFQSHALLADGVHSFSDLITDMTVLFASKYGSQSADDSHPYGHQRIETAATLLLALLLVLAGAGIAWDALDDLIRHEQEKPASIALGIAILSIIANEILFHYTRFVGKKINSMLVVANAWHHRSDSASSAVVAIGLIGSLAGFLYMDAVAATIVGLLIIKMGLDYGWQSVKELVDTAIDTSTLQAIEQAIQSMDGVKKIHQLRSRMMAGNILLDVHILVAPTISVSEGHYIAQHVHRTLINQFDKINDVTIHVDHEDDELSSPSFHLPNRSSLEKEFLIPWQQDFPMITHWTLHYLDGQLFLELFCNQPCDEKLLERVNKDIERFKEIAKVKIWC